MNQQSAQITENKKLPVLNYKKACLVAPTVIKKTSTHVVINKEPSIEEKWHKALNILSTRWEKYKNDYIEIYGQDTYEQMYVTPNYWVMPEDEEEEEVSNSEEDSYYDSYDELYNSDYDC